MTDIPSWLADAVGSAPARKAPPSSSDLADLMPGDIWTVRSERGGGIRLVLVLDCVFETNALHVGLLSNEVQFLSDADILLNPDETSLSYAVMLQTRFTGEVWWRQAVARYGAISEDLLDEILDFVWEDRPAALETRRGMPVPEHQRHHASAFLSAEVEALHTLVLASHGESEIPTLMDSDLLEREVPTAIQSVVAEALVTDSLYFFSAEERSGELRALEKDAASPRIAHDLLLQLLLERAQEQLLRRDAACVPVDDAGHGPASYVYCASSLPVDAPAIRLLSSYLHDPGPIGSIRGSQLFDAGIDF